MLDINPEGKKLILSIDGGGMRGMIAIAMLAELETMTGKTCPELFDMVAGTSTGAIIAAGFGLGMSAHELLETVYRRRLPDAFRVQPRGALLWLRYLARGLRYLYDLEPFQKALGPLAQGKRIRDLRKPIVLMTSKDLRTANTYYIVSDGPGLERVGDWPVVGAVAASGAAPIFFPPVLGDLVDGGVGVFGNPCLAATVEAMEYIGARAGFVDFNVIHFSLGTGYVSTGQPPGAGRRFWLHTWINYIINEGIHDSALQQVFSTRAIYRSRVDFRRYNPLLEANSVRDALGIDLTGRPDPSRLGLDSYEPEQVQLMEDIGRAYARRLNWTWDNYVPWNPANPAHGRDGGHPLPGIAPVNWPAQWSSAV